MQCRHPTDFLCILHIVKNNTHLPSPLLLLLSQVFNCSLYFLEWHFMNIYIIVLNVYNNSLLEKNLIFNCNKVLDILGGERGAESFPCSTPWFKTKVYRIWQFTWWKYPQPIWLFGTFFGYWSLWERTHQTESVCNL